MNKKMMRKYAALTARTGANVQKGQDVFITISAELHEFAALLAAESRCRRSSYAVDISAHNKARIQKAKP